MTNKERLVSISPWESRTRQALHIKNVNQIKAMRRLSSWPQTSASHWEFCDMFWQSDLYYMNLNINRNIFFFDMRGARCHYDKKKKKEGIIPKKCTRQITNMIAAFFKRVAWAVIVRKLGMIQRAAGQSSTWAQNVSQIPLWTSTVLYMSEWEAKRTGTE